MVSSFFLEPGPMLAKQAGTGNREPPSRLSQAKSVNYGVSSMNSPMVDSAPVSARDSR